MSCCGASKRNGIFGKRLEQICPETNPRVPEFIICCIEAIESTKENMTSNGIYRNSGNFSRVQKLKSAINRKNLASLKNEKNVDCLTGVLKLFIRELSEPLIPFPLFQLCLDAGEMSSDKDKIMEFKNIISKLPECNRQTLKYILNHLLRVASYSEKNDMDISNIAMVLAPTLLMEPTCKKLPDAKFLRNLHLKQVQALEVLMREFKQIFN